MFLELLGFKNKSSSSTTEQTASYNMKQKDFASKMKHIYRFTGKYWTYSSPNVPYFQIVKMINKKNCQNQDIRKNNMYTKVNTIYF